MNQAERNLLDFLRRASEDVRDLNRELLQPDNAAQRPPTPAKRDSGDASEDAMQMRLMRMLADLSWRYPELAWVYHVPNGGARSRATGGRMKAMGVRRGVFDLALDVARGPYHGLRVELKMPGNHPTPEQRAWIKFYSMQGYLAIVCYSAEDARDVFTNYLENSAWPY